MKSEIDVDSLKSILRDHLPEEKQAEIIREINKVLQEEEAEKNKEKGDKPPKVPKKSVIILTSLPDSLSEKDLEYLSGFYTEIPEDMRTKDVKEALPKIKSSYNNTKKAKKNPAHSLGELFELAPVKLFKEEGILKRPGQPLEFVFAPNQG